MGRATVRFNLVNGRNKSINDEPTSRMRGVRIYTELQKRGWDADRWDGRSHADVIVAQYGPAAVIKAAPFCDYVIWDCNDATFLPHHAYASMFESGLQEAAWITTGSPRLLEQVRGMLDDSPCTSYIPEAIDVMYDSVDRRTDSDIIKILWTGMDDNLQYCKVADSALATVAAKRDIDVVFVTTEATSHGQSNVETVRSKPYPSRHVVWSQESIVRELGTASIAIAPLYQCEWCWCKSPNKAAMFAGVGIPTVASDVPSYREFIEDGVSGFLPFSPDDWYEPLLRLVESSGLRETVGAAGMVAARSRYNIETVIKKWEYVLRRVLG